MQTAEKIKFIIGYLAASEFTGIPARRIYRMVEARKIRAIKPNGRTVMFHPQHLMEDLLAMEVEKV